MMQIALCNNKSKFHEGLTGFYVQQFRDIIWESMVYFFSKNSVPFFNLSRTFACAAIFLTFCNQFVFRSFSDRQQKGDLFKGDTSFVR